MTNIEKLREWAKAAKNNPTGKGEPIELTPTDSKDFWAIYDACVKAQRWILGARMSGNGDVFKNGFDFRFNAHMVTVKPPNHAPRGVTETSKAAYHSLNLPEQATKVAKAVIELLQTCEAVTDRMVSEKVGIVPSQVSARRNDIVKFGGIAVDGQNYTIDEVGTTKCQVTKKTVGTWRLVKLNNQFELKL